MADRRLRRAPAEHVGGIHQHRKRIHVHRILPSAWLPADDPFWAEAAADWTSRKAWNGVDVGADHALRDSKLK